MARLVGFATDQNAEQVFILRGYAGTGKTTMVGAFTALLREMKRPPVLLAPTGRAAKVFGEHAGAKAYTIHKQIYRRKSATDITSPFVLNFNKNENTLFIVDEASMIGDGREESSLFGSGNVLDDLMQFVYNNRGCRLLLVGDTAQLPPVGVLQSPALQPEYMARYQKEVGCFELTEVVRQAADSGILYNATMLRMLIAGQQAARPVFRIRSFPDIQAISGSDLLEVLSDSYDRVGQEDTLVVCRSNRRANRYNEGIRSRILFREEDFSSGDSLMVVRNNYFWAESTGHGEDVGFIANGDIIRVRRIRRFLSRYGFHFADAEVELTDYGITLRANILLDVLHTEQAALSSEDQTRLYYAVLEDYAGLPKYRQRAAMKTDPFYNALQVTGRTVAYGGGGPRVVQRGTSGRLVSAMAVYGRDAGDGPGLSCQFPVGIHFG